MEVRSVGGLAEEGEGVLRLDRLGCDVVTRGEEAAFRQVSADCAAMPPRSQPSPGRCWGREIPSVSVSAAVTAARLQHEEEGGEGQHVPQGEKEKESWEWRRSRMMRRW